MSRKASAPTVVEFDLLLWESSPPVAVSVVMFYAPVFSETIVGDPTSDLWIYREMNAGCFELIGVAPLSKLCQFVRSNSARLPRTASRPPQ
jgi:hypothetical protein